MKKKLISLALALIMVLSLLPVTAFAMAPVDSVAITFTTPTASMSPAGFADTVAVTTANVSVDLVYITVYNDNTFGYDNVSGSTTSFAPGTYRITIGLKTTNPDGFKYSAGVSEAYTGACTINGVGLDSIQGASAEVAKADYQRGVSGAAPALVVDYYFGIEAPAHNHVKGDHHNAKAATCEEDGTVEYWDCTGCDEKLDGEGNALESIDDPAIGHDFTEDAVYNEDGTHSFECAHVGCNAVGVGSVKNDFEDCADDNADHKCDECDRVMSECKDEDGDGFCDYEGCGQSMPTEPEPEPECKLPGFIGWIVNSMLRVVRLIIARITFEKYEPVIIGGVIVKIIGDIITK